MKEYGIAHGKAWVMLGCLLGAALVCAYVVLR